MVCSIDVVFLYVVNFVGTKNLWFVAFYFNQILDVEIETLS